jgi:hypothetical protein
MADLLKHYVAEIRGDREPTRRALAMLLAIKQHLADVLDDDPGDDNGQVWEDARTYLLNVEDAMRVAMRRAR